MTATSPSARRAWLSFASPPEYESPADSNGDNVYDVTIVARDDAFNSGTLDITITVTDQNEGAGDIGSAEPDVHREPGHGPGPGLLHRHRSRGPLRTHNALEPDRTRCRRLPYRRERPDHLPQRPRLREARRLRKDNEYNFSVRASDGRYYGYLVVTVTVQDVNEAPAITTNRQDGLQLPGERHGHHLYLQGHRPRAGDHRVVDFRSRRERLHHRRRRSHVHQSPELRITQGSGLDGNEYLVTVRCGTTTSNTSSLPVTVMVTDRNEGPEDNRAAEPLLHREPGHGPGPGHLLGQGPPRTRPQTSPVVPLRPPTPADFTIDENGQLAFRNIPDHEKPADSGRDNVYNLSIRASDGRKLRIPGDNRHRRRRETRPPPSAPPARPNSPTGRTARPPSTPSRPRNRSGGPSNGRDRHGRQYFAISETGVLYFTGPPDYESPADSGLDNVYDVTVVARDDAFNSGTLDVDGHRDRPERGTGDNGRAEPLVHREPGQGPGPWPSTRPPTPRTRPPP